MLKLLLGNLQWQAIPRLGVIILIMVIFSLLWYVSAARAVAKPCAGSAVSASHQYWICHPTDESVTASGRWFQRTFGSILIDK